MLYNAVPPAVPTGWLSSPCREYGDAATGFDPPLSGFIADTKFSKRGGTVLSHFPRRREMAYYGGADAVVTPWIAGQHDHLAIAGSR